MAFHSRSSHVATRGPVQATCCCCCCCTPNTHKPLACFPLLQCWQCHSNTFLAKHFMLLMQSLDMADLKTGAPTTRILPRNLRGKHQGRLKHGNNRDPMVQAKRFCEKICFKQLVVNAHPAPLIATHTSAQNCAAQSQEKKDTGWQFISSRGCGSLACNKPRPCLQHLLFRQCDGEGSLV
jgi:hypothetical protein